MMRRQITVMILLKKDQWLNLKIKLSMKGSGLQEKKLDKVKAAKLGQMDPYTKAGGRIIKQTEMVD